MSWAPTVEAEEKDGDLLVRYDLPGIDPKDVHVAVDKGVLTVSGERKTETKSKRVSEVRYGRFERSVSIPEDVNPDHIAARYANGVLEVTLPLPAEKKPRKVEIAVQTSPAKAA